MDSKFYLFIFISIFISSVVFCQPNPERRAQGFISGIVRDENSKAPIEYANAILFTSKDSVQVTGMITNKEGKFLLTGIRPGNYFLDVQFIGYEKKRIKNISVKPSTPSVDLGDIIIKPTAVQLNSVVVQGERSPISYQIDKKVVDVSKMGTVISGNAADVLENIPSVSVDIEGNVSLRGSGNFTVLVDGRPSVISNQDILQQIPASSIQTIEIVTNPSAKYDPEGTAGIINVVLKKNKNLGLSGVFNANAGFNDKYGGDFLFEYKTPSLKYSFGMDYNRRMFTGDSREEKRFILEDNNTSFVNSTGNNEMGRNSFGLRGSLEFSLSEKDFLTIGARGGSRDFEIHSNQDFREWTFNAPLQFNYLSRGNMKRSGTFFALNTNYQHKFNTEKHELSTEFFFSRNNSDEETVTSEITSNKQFSGKKTTESGPSTHLREKIDYTLPLSSTAKFEAGSQGEIEISDDNTGFYTYDTLNKFYAFQSKFSNDVKSNESELAVYSIYSDQFGLFGFQGGIRGEYTYRTIKINSADQQFKIDRWDYFPTVHTSYNFSEITQIMGSYTRRIQRPNGWQLEPFETWTSDKNVRKGNPALKPEFIDSYELGYKTSLLGISLTNEFYYRVTTNKVNFINTVYPASENITLTTFENVGKDYSLGAEFNFMFGLLKFWDVNLMGELYNYKVEGALNNNSFSRKSFNWSSRLNNVFAFSKATQLQINARYNSPTVTSQGKYEGFLTTDIALKHDLMEKSLSLTLQVRDIFKTAKREFTSSDLNLYNHTYGTRESPVVMLNLRFNFNNFKNDDRRREGPQQDSGMESGGEEF